MVKNSKLLESFDKRYIIQKEYSYRVALKIYDSLLKEARRLKKIPGRNLSEDVKSSLRIARILNSQK